MVPWGSIWTYVGAKKPSKEQTYRVPRQEDIKRWQVSNITLVKPDFFNVKKMEFVAFESCSFNKSPPKLPFGCYSFRTFFPIQRKKVFDICGEFVTNLRLIPFLFICVGITDATKFGEERNAF